MKWFGAAIAAVVAAGCGVMGKGTLEGAGPVKSETREASGFDAIEVGGAFVVDVKVGPKESVTVEAQENLLKEIVTRLDGSTLKIESEWSLNSREPIRVTVTTPKLREIHVTGAAQADVEGVSGDSFDLHASGASRVKLAGAAEELSIDESGASDVKFEGFRGKKLQATLSGASSLVTSGSVDDLALELSGASKFDGQSLRSGNAKVNASGGCNASVNADGRLSGTASGASSVRYRGNAKADVSTSGASSISRM